MRRCYYWLLLLLYSLTRSSAETSLQHPFAGILLVMISYMVEAIFRVWRFRWAARQNAIVPYKAADCADKLQLKL